MTNTREYIINELIHLGRYNIVKFNYVTTKFYIHSQVFYDVFSINFAPYTNIILTHLFPC